MTMFCEDDDVFGELGKEVRFGDDVAAAELASTINRQRSAILTLRKQIDEGKSTEAERAETIARMGEDLRAVHARVKQGAGVIWQPGGDAGDVTRRYLRSDGLVQFSSTVETVPLPRGGRIQVKRPGLLTDDKPVTREHAALVNAFFRYAFAASIGARGVSGASEAAQDIWIRGVVPAMQAMPGPVGDFLRTMLSDPATFERAMNATAGTGGELISNPTIGGALRTPRTLPRRVASRIAMQRAISKTFTVPIITGRALLRLQGAITDDPARATPQSQTTTSAAVTMKDLIANVLVQSTFFRDIQSSGMDGIMLIMAFLDQAAADTDELMLLHGDTAASHQDTLSTWTLGSYFASGQLDGSDAPTKALLGIRARAHDDSNTATAGGAFDAADHFGTLALLGNWGQGAICTVGVNGIYTLMANSLFTTVDKFGDRATLLTGQLGQIGNTPVDISEFLPKEFDTTSGLRTGSNAGNIAVYHNPAAMTLWDMEPADGGEFDVSEPHKGARYIGRTATRQITFNVPSGEKPAAVLYNLG